MARVLVVDDAADIRLLLQTILVSAGHTVAQAPGGAEALAELVREPAGFDLVVLDLQMPVMDGWDTLARIRGNRRTADTPVILCTVKSSAEDVSRAWRLAADGYLVKPFVVEEFGREVAAVLQRSPVERRAVHAERLASTATSTAELEAMTNGNR